MRNYLVVAALGVCALASAQSQPGYTGNLSSLMMGLQGEVVIDDSNTMTVKNFQVQGTGGAPLWWYGSMTNDIPHGFRISEEDITTAQTTATDLKVDLNAGKTPSDFNYVGLWCEAFSINFGQTKLTTGNANSTSVTGTTNSTSTSSIYSTATASATQAQASKGLGTTIAFDIMHVSAVAIIVSALLI